MKVTVVGAGTMGRGIAQVFAQAGNSVILTDIYPKALEDAASSIRSSIFYFNHSCNFFYKC